MTATLLDVVQDAGATYISLGEQQKARRIFGLTLQGPAAVPVRNQPHSPTWFCITSVEVSSAEHRVPERGHQQLGLPPVDLLAAVCSLIVTAFNSGNLGTLLRLSLV
jgi:hypothetical protein